MTRIAVVGTGANGAGIGADLIRAGLDVTFVEQWPENVEAMRRRGIEVRTPMETTTTRVHPLHLCEVATLRHGFDLVFLLVKAYDTRWATELIKPVLASDGIVVGLQNGMTADAIADIVGLQRALGAVIEVSSAMWEPGIVERHVPAARSWFAVGSLGGGVGMDRVEHVAQILRHSGRVEISSDVWSAKWMKLVVNAAELVPAAIVGEPMRSAVALPGMRDFMIQTGIEAMDAAVGAGATPAPIFGLAGLDGLAPTELVTPLVDAVFDQFALDSTTTTVHQDWSKGRRSEVDEINGLVVRRHRESGTRADLNEVIVTIGHEIERGESTPGRHQLPRLLGAMDRG